MSDPHEQELLNDAADGKWDRHTTLSAALIAEGVVDDGKLSQYQSRMNHLVGQLKEGRNLNSPEFLAKKAFESLHRNLLVGGYDQNCTHLAHTIDTGQFNCVSATILYHAMAEELGLDVCGLEIRGHALSRVKLQGNKPLDLETTCANWFDIRNNPALQQEAIRRVTVARPIGFAGQNASTTGMSETVQEDLSRRSFREISAVQLIATIYYNQGVDLINARKFDQSLAANVKSLHLDPENENAWGNLLATINNQALDVSSRQDYAEAVKLLKQGLTLDPHYELFQNNLHCIYFQWITAEAEQEDLDSALQLCEEAVEYFPDRKNLRFLQYKICHKNAQELLNTLDFQAAFARYDQASRFAPEEIRTAEIEVSDALACAEELFHRNQHARCVELLNGVIDRHGSMTQPVIPVIHLTAVVSPLPEMTVSQRPFELAASHHVSSATVSEEQIQKVIKLRTQVVSQWAGESFRLRDYPEAVRRIRSGATDAGQMPKELSDLLADVHRQWIGDLLAEGRTEEADYLKQQTAPN